MNRSREEMLADELDKIAKTEREVGPAVALPESRIKIIEEAAAALRTLARENDGG